MIQKKQLQPHIKLNPFVHSRRQWTCVSLNSRMGYGSTPSLAYTDWRFRLAFPQLYSFNLP